MRRRDKIRARTRDSGGKAVDWIDWTDNGTTHGSQMLEVVIATATTTATATAAARASTVHASEGGSAGLKRCRPWAGRADELTTLGGLAGFKDVGKGKVEVSRSRTSCGQARDVKMPQRSKRCFCVSLPRKVAQQQNNSKRTRVNRAAIPLCSTLPASANSPSVSLVSLGGFPNVVSMASSISVVSDDDDDDAADCRAEPTWKLLLLSDLSAPPGQHTTSAESRDGCREAEAERDGWMAPACGICSQPCQSLPAAVIRRIQLFSSSLFSTLAGKPFLDHLHLYPKLPESKTKCAAKPVYRASRTLLSRPLIGQSAFYRVFVSCWHGLHVVTQLLPVQPIRLSDASP